MQIYFLLSIIYRQNVRGIVVVPSDFSDNIANGKQSFVSGYFDMGGASCSQSNIVPFWKAISYLFPSTHGVQGIIKINTMQANLYETGKEFAFLWGLSAFYFVTACVASRLKKRVE